jgi:hypothetical protein
METKEEKRCFVEYLRERYRRARKKAKGAIIDELSSRIGIGRKQAMRLLGSQQVGRPKKPGKAGRPSKYRDMEFIQSLRIVWKTSRYMGSRHLHSAIPEWLPFIEMARGKFTPDIKLRLLQISAPTIDRILSPYKVHKGKSFTRPGGFRDEIPIQENIWNISVPGFTECDTVAHCGGSMHGEFVNSVVLVDIATIWTEARAVFGRGSIGVFDALLDIEANLPFELLGYDADNGGEVLNQHIINYFLHERPKKGLPAVQVTRSREYHKNDNAHIEQRNDSLARGYLGYERLGFQELVSLINYYYAEIVCPMINHFFPTFKLKDKKRIKSRTRRVYDKPITPYARIMASPEVSQDRKDKLKKIHIALNPVTLVQREKFVRQRIDDALKRLKIGSNIDSLLDGFQYHIKQNIVNFYQVSQGTNAPL